MKKVNKGKLLLYQSFLRVSGNTGGLGKFTHDAGRVNFNYKLTFSFNSINLVTPDSVDTQDCLKLGTKKIAWTVYVCKMIYANFLEQQHRLDNIHFILFFINPTFIYWHDFTYFYYFFRAILPIVYPTHDNIKLF